MFGWISLVRVGLRTTEMLRRIRPDIGFYSCLIYGNSRIFPDKNYTI